MVELDELVEMSRDELDHLFREGDTPEMDGLEGVSEGRVLAGRGALRAEPVRRIVNNPLLPWKGKHVEGRHGSNRFEVGPLERKGFEFDMYVTESLNDEDDDVLIFDYDTPENPPGIRRIRDDLKEVDDGLFLGTSNVRVGDGYRFLTYFALNANRPRSPASEEEAEVQIS